GGFTDFPLSQELPSGPISPPVTIPEFTVPPIISPTAGGFIVVRLEGLTIGPDGNIWFTEFQYEGQGNIFEPFAHCAPIRRPTPPGTLTQFAIPGYYSIPQVIIAGPDGNLWFTEPQDLGDESDLFTNPPADPLGSHPDRIGRITPGGVITIFL